MNENIFGVLLKSAFVSTEWLMSGYRRESVARLPKILEDSIMRRPFKATVINHFHTLDCHDGYFLWPDSNDWQNLTITSHVRVVVHIASFILISLPKDVATREWRGPVNRGNPSKGVYPVFVKCI